MGKVSHFRLMPVKHGRGKGPQLSVQAPGAFDEEWTVCIGDRTCDVAGASVGVVLTDAPTRPVIAPLNPVSMCPYFVLRLPRSVRAGDVFVFRTESATPPEWVGRVRMNVVSETCARVSLPIGRAGPLCSAPGPGSALRRRAAKTRAGRVPPPESQP